MEENQEYEQIKTSNAGLQRFVNVLELLDSKPTHKDLWLYIAGYAVVNIDGVDLLRRVNKPIFSDDYTQQLFLDYTNASNIITTQTTFKAEEIRLHIQHKALAFNRDLMTNGRSYYVTREIWRQIRADWAKRHIDWTQGHITSNMVEKYRSMQDLDDFTSQTEKLVDMYILHVRAALNRSLDALTLEHHKQVEIAEQKITAPKRRGLFSMRRGGTNDVA